MKVLMHAKPMRRHTSAVREASCDTYVRSPSDFGLGHPNPGLHLVFTVDGADQRVIFGADAIEALAVAVKMARTALEVVDPVDAEPAILLCEALDYIGDDAKGREARVRIEEAISRLMWRAA